MVVPSWDPSALEVEAGGLGISGQPWWHSNASLELYEGLSQINLEMGAQGESIQGTAEGSSSQGGRLHASMCGLLQGLASLWQKRQK